ncbi:MAG: cation:proton antiporter [Bacteroidota bacterium]
MHDLSIIITLAGGLAVALVFGWVTQRLGLSTLVGYMLAGIVVGPYTPGFVADASLASQMAEIGVILLMFGVGLHFHPQELLRVWRIAVPGAVAQSAVAAAAGWAIARAFGWTHAAGMVFGMALAVASTVVLMRMLVAQDRLATRDGHVAVGWLIVEDIFTVVALVMLPALAAERSDPAGVAGALGLALGKAAVFAALVWAVGSRLVAPVMERIARTRSTELFTLTVFVVALGVALLAAEVFSVSVALGAFFAGLVVGQSRFGPQAAADMVPFRDVFSALFFVSVGMLFNPSVVTEQPLLLAGAIAIVLIVKPAIALAIVKLLRDTQRTALTVAVGLAQIGEFSFILGVLGQQLGILPAAGMDILVAAAIVSIAVNPLLFRAVAARDARAAAGATETPRDESAAPASATDVGPAVALTGLGELGRRIVRRCAEAGVPVLVIDPDPDVLAELRGRGVAVLRGDPVEPDVLRAAGLADARMIVVTNPTLAEKMRICIGARQVNPRIAIVATSGSGAERAWLHEFGAAFVCDAIDEMTESLVRTVRGGL